MSATANSTDCASCVCLTARIIISVAANIQKITWLTNLCASVQSDRIGSLRNTTWPTVTKHDPGIKCNVLSSVDSYVLWTRL